MSSGLISNLKVIVELFTFLYCLAEIFGKKLKISIHAVVMIIVNLFILAGINDFGFPLYFRSLCHLAIFLYGLLYYREGVKLTLINCFLASVIVSILQLALYLPSYHLLFYKYGADHDNLNELLINSVCFLCIVLCSRKIELKKLSDFCIKRNKLVVAVTLLILCGVGFNFYQIMNKRLIAKEAYVQMIYFVLIILFIIYEWQKSRMDAEKRKAQLEMNSLYFEAYDQLIMLVRERQHDTKNHINAILSLAYTTENYDELIAKQKEYCGYVIAQNEKTKLVLSSGNPLIAGFLYSKIREAENYNISIDYKVGIEKAKTIIPEYELVEMAGILLDNAIEALNNMREEDFVRRIYFSIKETEDNMTLVVANTSPHYEEVLTEHFFEAGYSSKGQNRGIGLSKLKRLVQARKGNITVYNELRDKMNYLTFEIELQK